jgi:lipid A 4'-phosphatase
MSKNQQLSDTAALRSRRFLLGADFLIPFLLLIATVIVFRRTELDITIQKLFYQPQSGWFLKDMPLFRFLYHYGNLPAIIISIAGLVLLGLSYQAMKWAKWRKIGLFLVLAMLLGPGLVINTVLKDHWGRPRPRNIRDFGGKYAHEKVLSIDPESPGKSFPCGHASMGFYLFIPWFVLRKKKSLWAAVSLASGIGMGLAIGIARIAQGGHFASDVVIAGLLVYLIGAAIHDMLKFKKALWYYHKAGSIDRRQRSVVSAVVLVMIALALLSVAVATPYSKSKTHHPVVYILQDNAYPQVNLSLYNADMTLTPSNDFRIEWEAQGFGFPRSKLITAFSEEARNDTVFISYTQRKKGMFTELENKVHLLYRFDTPGGINLKINKGTAVLAFPDTLRSFTLSVEIESGTLELDLPSAFKPRIKLRGDFTLDDRTGFNDLDGIFINEDFRLDLVVKQGTIILR